MEDPKTYYEQVPVAVVKKIAELLPVDEREIEEREEDDTDGSIPPAVDASGPDAWQELAKLAQEETDPKKMIDLVQQLIEKYDQEKMRTASTYASKPMAVTPTS